MLDVDDASAENSSNDILDVAGDGAELCSMLLWFAMPPPPRCCDDEIDAMGAARRCASLLMVELDEPRRSAGAPLPLLSSIDIKFLALDGDDVVVRVGGALDGFDCTPLLLADERSGCGCGV